MEIEVPVERPRTFYEHPEVDFTLKLDTVLMAIYYPAALGTGRGRDPAGNKKWSRQLWLPRPRSKVARGYGKFFGAEHLGIPWFFATSWFTKLHAFRNARLADHWPPPQPKEGTKKTEHDWNQKGDPPAGAPDHPVFPLMMFSHGLGGTKTAYSSLCGEFASYGFVVCALEHRDGSGPRTFVNRAEAAKADKESEESDELDESQQDNIPMHTDYFFPPDNPYDTAPSNKKGIDTKLRSSQLKMRLAEIREAYKVIKRISHGHGENVAKANLRVKGGTGASSRGLDGVRWEDWKGRVLLDNATMLGHSFGAATTIEVLRSKVGYDWVGQGVIYDIWA